jgi:hypothetical protein
MISFQGDTMKAVTVRGVDPDISEKLKATAKDQGISVNQLILELIKTGLGLQKEKKYSRRYSDLDDLFGRWGHAEFTEINDKITQNRRIDPELWES